MVYAGSIKKYELVENEITEHFIRLHNILHNLEHQLKEKLHNQNENIQRHIEEYRNVLSCQKEKLTTVVAMVNKTVEGNHHHRVNTKKFIDELLEFASAPYHIIQIDDYDHEISIEIDSTVLDSLNQHIQLHQHVPDIPKIHLLATDQLPENYKQEPVSDSKHMNLSFKVSSRRETSSTTSSSETSSSLAISPNESLTGEPSSTVKGTTERVKVTAIINPTDFYVQQLNQRRFLSDIEADIAKYVKNSLTPPEEVIINRVYIVQYSKNHKWYRGRMMASFTNFNGETSYNVHFIDYGLYEKEVTLDRIRNVLPQFNLTPGFALHCSLHEIAPMNIDWDENVISQFTSMVVGCKLYMRILESNDPMHVVDLHRLNDDSNKIYIRDWLIDSNLAKRTTFYKLQKMNPLSAQHFYYEELPLEKYTDVDVSYVESPSSIYVRKRHGKEYEEKMKAFYKQYKEHLKKADQTIQNPEYGSPVAIGSPPYWQRGIVTQIFAEVSKVHVFLVDFGSTAVVDYKDVTNLPNRFCTWNAQAIKVSLIDIEPAGDENWSTESACYLKSNLEGRTVKVIPFSRTGNTYHVCIYVDDTSINANLVSMNFASSTGIHSRHQTLNKDITTSKGIRRKMANKIKSAYTQKKGQDNVPSRRKVNKTVEERDPFKVRVLINKIESPDAIYVSEINNICKYEKMIAKMQKFYETRICEWDKKLIPNSYYCVYSRKDKLYCRAQFLQMSDSEPHMAKMLLVDLAEADEFSIENIKPIDKKFLLTPKFMFKIKLAGIRPCGGTNVWQSSSCEKLKEIIYGPGDTKYYITLISHFEAHKSMPVDLFIRQNIVAGPTEPNRKETFSVARRLIEDGLALPIRGYVDNDGKELAIELMKKLHLDSSQVFYDKHLSGSNLTIIDEESTINRQNDELLCTEKEYNIVDAIRTPLEDISSEFTLLPPIVSDWIAPPNFLQNTFNASLTYVDYDCNIYFHPDTKECT